MVEACLLEDVTCGWFTRAARLFLKWTPMSVHGDLFFQNRSNSSENKVQSFTEAASIWAQMCRSAKGRTVLFINFQPIRLSPWLHDTPHVSNSQDSPRLVGVTHLSSSWFSPKHTRTSSLGLPHTKRREWTLSPSPKEEEWEMQARAEEQEIQVSLQVTKIHQRRNKIHTLWGRRKSRNWIKSSSTAGKKITQNIWSAYIQKIAIKAFYLEKWRQPPEEGKVETMKVSAFEKQPASSQGEGLSLVTCQRKGKFFNVFPLHLGWRPKSFSQLVSLLKTTTITNTCSSSTVSSRPIQRLTVAGTSYKKDDD